ncbi:MAG: peptidase M50 [Firmicutes bacterium]|nr:peptidase M50 [Bacillota bacterium]
MIVGKILGIRLRLNWFFLLLLGLTWWVGILPQILLLFAIVLLHEFAHGLAARGFGLKVEEVELLPFGGVARISDPLEHDPGVEATVAIVGPMTNFFLALCGVMIRPYLDSEPLVEYFIQANLILGGFNLIPALPLDGGRILRAYLTPRLGWRQATEQAVRLAKVISVILVLLGIALLYTNQVNVSLIVIAFFVFFAADREKNLAPYTFIRYLVGKKEELTQQGVMSAEPLVAQAHVPVREVVRKFGPKRYHLVAVIDAEGRVEQVLSEWEVLDVFLERGVDIPVGEAKPPSQ